MKQQVWLWLIALVICGLIGCKGTSKATYNPDQKFSPAQLNEDFSLLQKTLQANHPSLYWYTPKDSVDRFFAIAHAALQDSLSEKEFKNKVAWVISKIKCGHTAPRHSKAYSKYYQKKPVPVFPLSIKIWKDSAVVVANVHRKDSILTRGTIVTSINNRSIQTIVDSIFSMLGADGNAINFKYQVTSFNFPAYYKNAFGLDSPYIIHYIDSTGKKNSRVVQNFYPKSDTAKQPAIVAPFKLTRKERRAIEIQTKRDLQLDTALSTAILSVNTFSDGKLKNFFRSSFKQIEKSNLKNVVIDLRQNSGGNILSSTNLTQYLVDKPFKIADTVAAISRKFAYRRHIKPWFLYWLSMRVTGRRMKDNRIHFRYFEQHYFRPKKRHHFNGNIYLVTGGYTFSAATLITGALIYQENVIVVGEETGGGAYGNTAMHLPVIVLPNTKVRVTLPLYRIVINKSLPKNGRGIMPDVEVGPSSYLISKGIDGKMQKVRDLILSSKN